MIDKFVLNKKKRSVLISKLRSNYLESLSKSEGIAYRLNHYLAEHPELSGQEYQSVKNY